MSDKISAPGASIASTTQAFSGTSASKALGMSGYVRFKAVGNTCYVRFTKGATGTAVTTDYPLTDGVAEDFYFVTDDWYVSVIDDGTTGTLHWAQVG